MVINVGPVAKRYRFYKNSGLFAGASLRHSHTQIIALPFIPEQLKGIKNYYQENNQCLLCDILKQEQRYQQRIVYETEHFLVLCPFASRFTFETLIIPKRHQARFDSINSHEIEDLARVSKKIVQALADLLQNPSYNLVINTAPVNVDKDLGYHWFIEIYPRLIVQAGVEIATGMYMNPVSPEWAADSLREKIADPLN